MLTSIRWMYMWLWKYWTSNWRVLHRGKQTWQWKANHLKVYILFKMVFFHCHGVDPLQLEAASKYDLFGSPRHSKPVSTTRTDCPITSTMATTKKGGKLGKWFKHQGNFTKQTLKLPDGAMKINGLDVCAVVSFKETGWWNRYPNINQDPPSINDFNTSQTLLVFCLKMS